MYYSYGQRPSPSVDGWYMVWKIHDVHMITGDEYGPNFLTFLLRLRENPAKTSTRKLTRPGIEPGPAAWEVTISPLDHSGGHLNHDHVEEQTMMSYSYRVAENWCEGEGILGQVAQAARRLATGWTAWVRSRVSEGGDFSSLLRVQTGPGVHSVSCKMKTVGFPRG